MENLAALMAHMEKTWECNKERYPLVALLSREAKTAFVVRHSLMHLMKSKGKIAEVKRRFDFEPEYAPQDLEQIRVAAVKLFVNGINLAREVGYSADAIAVHMASCKRQHEPTSQLEVALGVIAAVCEKFDHDQDYDNWCQTAVAKSALDVVESVIEFGKGLGLSQADLIDRAPEFVH
jgi:hypothetical protein